MAFHTFLTVFFGAFLIFSIYFVILWLWGIDKDDEELKQIFLLKINKIKFSLKK